MEHLVLTLNTAWPTPMRAVDNIEMSAEDFTMGLPTVEPHGHHTMHPPQQYNTTDTHTSHPPPTETNIQNPPPLPSYATTNSPSSVLYSKTPLKPPSPNNIRIIFNNVNTLPVEEAALLAKTLEDYFIYEPMILGLIKTKRNFYLTNKMMTPLRHMAQACSNSLAKIRLVTASCKEDHTARNLKEPGGVCQLTLGRILNLYKQSGSNDLG